MTRVNEKDPPRTFAQQLARCRHNGWRITEYIRHSRGERLQVVTRKGKPRTLIIRDPIL